MTFEARLSNALDRYADRAPAEADLAAVAREATGSRSPLGNPSRPFTWARWSIWLRVGIAVALLALVVVVIALIGRPQSPPLGGGRLMVSLGTTSWVFEPLLTTPRQVVNAGCGSTLVDGGAQIATSVRLGPFQMRPIDADPSAVIGITQAKIPGYGGTNAERWSPDGSGFALMRTAKQSDEDPSDGIGAMMVMSIHGAIEPTQAIFEIGGLVDFAWSDDSRHIAAIAARGEDVELIDIDLALGTQRAVATYRPALAYPSVDWVAGTSKLAVWISSGDRGRPAIIDARSGAMTIVDLPPDLETANGASALWAPDGAHVAVYGSGPTGVLLDVAAGTPVELPPGVPIDTFRGPEMWSPNSRHLALIDGDTFRVIDVDGREIGSFQAGGGQAPTMHFAWSTDGSSFALLTQVGGGIEIAMHDATTLAKTASATISTSPLAASDDMCLQWVRPKDPGD